MFQLKICDIGELQDAITTFNPTHIISAINTTVDRLPGKHLHINIGDITTPMEGHVLPTMDHLRIVLNFTEELTDSDRLLVHCFAGQSRSTALAIGILIQHGMDYVEAFNRVAELRNILLPNRLLIHLIDEHFNLGGDLDALVTDFYRGEFKRLAAPPGQPSPADVDWIKQMMERTRGCLGSDAEDSTGI